MQSGSSFDKSGIQDIVIQSRDIKHFIAGSRSEAHNSRKEAQIYVKQFNPHQIPTEVAIGLDPHQSGIGRPPLLYR